MLATGFEPVICPLRGGRFPQQAGPACEMQDGCRRTVVVPNGRPSAGYLSEGSWGSTVREERPTYPQRHAVQRGVIHTLPGTSNPCCRLAPFNYPRGSQKSSLVPTAGFEPASTACRAAARPLSYAGKVVDKEGVEPSSSACKAVALPLSYEPVCVVQRGSSTAELNRFPCVGFEPTLSPTSGSPPRNRTGSMSACKAVAVPSGA